MKVAAGCTEANDCESADVQRRVPVIERQVPQDSDMDTSVRQWGEQVAKRETKK